MLSQAPTLEEFLAEDKLSGVRQPYEREEEEDEPNRLPEWYKEWTRGYVPKSGRVVSFEELQRGLAQSDELQEVVGREIAASQGAYGSFSEIARQYMAADAEPLREYLSAQGREFYPIVRVETADLGGATAAFAPYGDAGVLMGDTRFPEKVGVIAAKYGVPFKLAARYVLDHEFVHSSQKGQLYRGSHWAETDVEQQLSSFYQGMAEKDSLRAPEYRALKGIANDRQARVPTNYQLG